ASGSADGTILLWEFTPIVLRVVEDVNGDGVVNIQDLVLVASNFGQTGANPADVNSDGVVNIQDLVLVASNFGQN
ncbi:MAG: dockerin type I domain-containing protein, partial [Candidatus Poribacteria bacterium]|nr:dockerin type I domain-containing protein [Candidatus Poribacteria bacterium]